MPSPRGVFSLLTVDELAAMRASAISQIQSGRRTSLPSDPMEILAEVTYAEQKLGIIPARVTKTYGEFTGVPPFPVVTGEQV